MDGLARRPSIIAVKQTCESGLQIARPSPADGLMFTLLGEFADNPKAFGEMDGSLSVPGLSRETAIPVASADQAAGELSR